MKHHGRVDCAFTLKHQELLVLLGYNTGVSLSYFELVFTPFHPGTTAFADHTGAN